VSPEWSSANAAVATVGRSDGVVTAIGEGSTTLTVTAGDASAHLDVTVIDVHGTIAFSSSSRRSDGTLAYDLLSYTQREESSLRRSSQLHSMISPSWSPDGTQLAVEAIRNVVEHPGDDHIVTYDSDLYVFDAQGPVESHWSALTSDGRSRSPSWSPDGKQIAFIRGSSETGGTHVYLIEVDGGGLTRVTPSPGPYDTPRWSPDGSRLAFADGSIGNGDIFTIRADGTGLTNVTRSPEVDYTPAWSPDGTRLAFISRRNGDWGGLFVIASDGGDLRRLTDLGYAFAPVWSPDGRYIAFGSGGIWVVDAQSDFPIRVTRSGGSYPAWKR
jgi:TolB protein